MSYLFFKNSIRGKDIDIENSSTKILTKTSFIFPTSSNRVCVLKVFWDNILQCSNCLTLIWGGGGNFIPPMLVFPLITQKWWKLKPRYFTAFSNVLLETFVPNFVSITHLRFGQNPDRGISDCSIPYERKLP